MFLIGRPRMRQTLTQVPLEQFEDVLAYCREIGEATPLTVLAHSKGAEYALNLAVRYDAIDHLVLFAPSAYTFSGLRIADHSSSWTWGRRDVPCIDQKRSYGFLEVRWPLLTLGPVRFRDAYETAVVRDDDREAKRIRVEDTDADMLLLAGEDDQVWDASRMAATIEGHAGRCTVRTYPDAGTSSRGTAS